MDRLRKFIPVAYATQLSPGKGRTGIDAPTWVYAYDYLVLANDKVPDEAAYKLAKIMHDHKTELAAGFGALSGFDPGRMTKDLGPVQFHPGRHQVLQGNRRLAAEEWQLTRTPLQRGTLSVRRNPPAAGGPPIDGHPLADSCRRQPAHARARSPSRSSSIAACWSAAVQRAVPGRHARRSAWRWSISRSRSAGG